MFWEWERFHQFIECKGFRATTRCDPDLGAPDEPNDKLCVDDLQESLQSGYCECDNKKRVMKKGCERPAFYGYGYKTCKEACFSKGVWTCTYSITFNIYPLVYFCVLIM